MAVLGKVDGKALGKIAQRARDARSLGLQTKHPTSSARTEVAPSSPSDRGTVLLPSAERGRDLPPLTVLPDLSRAALTALWTRLFDRPVPKGLSPQLMIRFLAFEIQARAAGGLPAGFIDTLAQRAGAAAAVPKPAARLRPGGRLLREWNGVTHVVDVDTEGFLWSGRRFGSLSAIAKEITGAHWSGPRFFGLAGGGAAAVKTATGTGSGAAGRASKASSAKPRMTAGAGPRELASKRSLKGASKGPSKAITPVSGGAA